MKISNFFNQFKGLFGSLFEHLGGAAATASHIHSGVAALGAIMGKEPGPNDPPSAWALHGLFGFKDEREFAKLLMRLDGRAGVAANKAIILGWWGWQFPQGNRYQRRIAWWYGNKLRTELVKLGTDAERRRFLGKMVATIVNNGGGVRGYRALSTELRNEGFPIPPPDAEAQLRRYVAQYRATRRAVNRNTATLDAELVRVNAQRRRWWNPLGWLDRLAE